MGSHGLLLGDRAFHGGGQAAKDTGETAEAWMKTLAGRAGWPGAVQPLALTYKSISANLW